MQPQYLPPDFTQPRLQGAPDARFVPAPADGVLPEGFFATTNLPTYVRLDGRWTMPRFPRMDGAIVRTDDGGLEILEGRYVRAGQLVAVGMAEDGSEGIYVHATGFTGEGGRDDFAFMRSEVSREKPVDYALMARLRIEERERGGHVVWVVGRAVLRSRGRDGSVWFLRNGFVNALLGGNAVGGHDIE